MKTWEWALVITGTAGGLLFLGCKASDALAPKPLSPSPGGGGGSLPSYDPTPSPPPFVPQGPTGPRQLTGDPLTPEPGGRYWATVQVHAPASFFASKSKVKAAAEAKGFTNVGVSDTRPSGWPGTAQGSYYVSGTYAGAPQTMARTAAMGQVNAVDVWKG
jgi:hypothetical protein